MQIDLFTMLTIFRVIISIQVLWPVSVTGGFHYKITQTKWLKHHIFKQFSQSSGTWKSELQVSLRSVCGENFPPGLQRAAFLLCPHMNFLQCAHTEMSLVSLPLFIRTQVLADQGPANITSLNLNYLVKGLVSKYSPIGVRASK